MASAIVRKAELNDTDSIAKIHVLTWQDAYKKILPQNFLNNLSIARRADHWKETIKFNQSNGKNGLYVLAEDGDIYGFAAFGAAQDKEFHGYGEIYAIYVLPKYQKHGYGGRLFEKAKSFLIEKGYKKAYVWSLENNASAHKAYEKWGAEKSSNHKKNFTIDDREYSEIAHFWQW